MSSTPFLATIDWEQHWAETDRSELSEMRAAGERMARRLERYFDTFPASLADVGCGPAFTLFDLAATHPDVELVGYDAAGSVLRENRARAADRDLENLAFRHGRLPELSADLRFECVTCIATLHYVADVATAIRHLLALVEPGGTLVFNYPNSHTRRMYRDDPATDPERFELVLEGENLLTYDRIREITGRRPRSFWKAVDEDDWRSIGRTNPCVVIER
jgi:2-polyprenyl-3-methyl-5-hydroxy-6-metoxy-1,4-benzoquinol methylase